MADLKQAVDFVMRQEDSTLSGIITDRKSDRGGRTRFGLAERWHPELTGQGFYDYNTVDKQQVPKMPNDEALTIAENTFAGQYADSLKLASIESQGLATALLSFAVVEGPEEAITLLQKAIVSIAPPIKQPPSWDYKPPVAVIAIDGVVGQKTLDYANATDPVKLTNMLVAFTESHFQHIAQVIPSQAVNLHGWMNRAIALKLPISPLPPPVGGNGGNAPPQPGPEPEPPVSA